MKMRLSQIGLFTSTIIAAATLAACGGGGASAPSGTLGVAMTDAPSCGFDAVNITVSKVRVHQSASAGESDGGWTDITLNPARKINLLNLTNGALETLGETPLAAGHYTQLRLVLDPNTGNALSNSVIPSGTTAEQTLDTPSAVQSGIKLVNAFDVVAGQRVDLVLDFNACKSVVTKGNGKYALKPVVKVIPTILNGIAGFVGTAFLDRHVMVTAQQNGVIVGATTLNATTGEFFLARLAPGNYDVAITADDSATAVIATVPVASTTSTTAVSTSGAPLLLAPSLTGTISGTASLTPASSTEVAYVAATQSFAPGTGSGPTIVVRYQGADISTGAYTLSNLPIAAPQFVQYSAVLPLVFAPAPGTTPGTGKYRLDATATGYGSKSLSSVDISAANQSNVNFALVP